MARIRVVLVVLAALLVTTLTALPAAAQLDFGDVDLGEIKSQCFGICFDNDCAGTGTINSLNTDAPFYIRGLRLADADDDFCDNVPGITTPVTLPVVIPPGQSLVVDLDVVADGLGFFNRDVRVNGDALLDAQVDVLPAPPCPTTNPNLLCLQGNRFTVRGFWRTQFGTRGAAPEVNLGQGVTVDDSGLLYFFNPNNWEMLLKVLDGCPINDHFWVFAAATTNVEVTITVTDTQTNSVTSYFNPLGQAAPAIQDTQAFATCP